MIDTIIFDLGGVLIDHKPEHLFLDEFNGDREKMNWFLQNVCTSEWNIEQDGGRTIEEATLTKIAEFPEHEYFIRTYYNKWEKMCNGSIDGTLEIFETLKKNDNYKCYALTNFSDETWPAARKMYPYLDTFDGMVVSGKEKIIKPNAEIYNLLLNRYNLTASNSVFIDDRLENIEGAKNVGIHGIHFQNPTQLAEELKLLGVKY
jgi:2-haloacid dehalogenase